MPAPATPAALAAAIAFTITAAITSAFAGPLTPPAGPPAPTNTTLQQIEPRTDIATLAGDADSLHRITQAGSYFLSGNISHGGAGQAVIEVNADDVTIDLQGFQLSGQQTADSGIRFVGTPEGTTITNGSLRWFAGAAIDGSISRNTTVTHVSVRDSDVAFLFPNGPTNLTDCHAFNCGEQVNFFAAFVVFNGGTLTRCIAEAGPSGGFVVDWVTMRDCLALDNTDRGFEATRATLSGCVAVRNADGISISQPSVVENCVAHDNDDDGFIGDGVFRSCGASFNSGDGFVLTQGGLATQCLAHSNSGNGFRVSFATLTDCVAEANSLWGYEGGGFASMTATNCHAIVNGSGGFRGGNGDTFTNCHVSNGSTGSRAGFDSADHSSALDCSVDNNTVGNAFTFGDHATLTRCVVRASAGNGIVTGANSTVADCNVTETASQGIATGAYSRIERCLVEGAGLTGINASSHTIMVDCVVDASGQGGIDADANSIVLRCISENNTNQGIDADDNSIVRDSIAASNGTVGIVGDNGVSIINCMAASNGTDGISVGIGAIIRDCNARGNVEANYRLENDSRITNSHADGGQFGIITANSDVVIDGNTVVDATGVGISLNGSGAAVTRNTVHFTIPATGYFINAGNSVGTVRSTYSGAGPWDNFAF